MLSALDLAGWVGGAVGAAAYVLVSRGRIAPDSTLFQGLNMVGAAMLASASLSHGALPSAVMNVVWIVFGVQVLASTARVRRRRSRPDECRVSVFPTTPSAGSAGLEPHEVPGQGVWAA